MRPSARCCAHGHAAVVALARRASASPAAADTRPCQWDASRHRAVADAHRASPAPTSSPAPTPDRDPDTAPSACARPAAAPEPQQPAPAARGARGGGCARSRTACGGSATRSSDADLDDDCSGLHAGRGQEVPERSSELRRPGWSAPAPGTCSRRSPAPSAGCPACMAERRCASTRRSDCSATSSNGRRRADPRRPLRLRRAPTPGRARSGSIARAVTTCRALYRTWMPFAHVLQRRPGRPLLAVLRPRRLQRRRRTGASNCATSTWPGGSSTAFRIGTRVYVYWS